MEEFMNDLIVQKPTQKQKKRKSHHVEFTASLCEIQKTCGFQNFYLDWKLIVLDAL
jgi:hypothetical protein